MQFYLDIFNFKKDIHYFKIQIIWIEEVNLGCYLLLFFFSSAHLASSKGWSLLRLLARSAGVLILTSRHAEKSSMSGSKDTPFTESPFNLKLVPYFQKSSSPLSTGRMNCSHSLPLICTTRMFA